MKKVLFLSAIALSLFANSSVVNSLDKARQLAKMYEKPIICFFDEALSSSKREDLAKEYFSHKDLYDTLSSDFIFTHASHGESGSSGFMVLSKDGKVLGNITTYSDFKALSEKVTGKVWGSASNPD